jgi:hypothetical protein
MIFWDVFIFLVIAHVLFFIVVVSLMWAIVSFKILGFVVVVIVV